MTAAPLDDLDRALMRATQTGLPLVSEPFKALAEQLGKELGHTVIVDNKAGANGAIGASEVIRSAPDGGTLWFTSVGAAAINPSLYERLAYDTQRDLAPVALVVNNVELLVVNPANPARDAAEFIANSKKRKDPTPMASSGIGSIPQAASPSSRVRNPRRFIILF